jgi:hypothetical protein
LNEGCTTFSSKRAEFRSAFVGRALNGAVE